ncbi:MAG: ATP-binding cassette domain-containing protein [Actinomycetota bacterium]|nr:ATP-binding cassette domain-containing protein [Actinomycetota bacterium]
MARTDTISDDRWPEGSLRATDVSRSYEGVQALEGISLEIHRHEVVGLIGPNGAGKTTLINLITGFDLPTNGRIMLGEDDVTTWQVRRRARAGLARTFQHGHLFATLTVQENIELAAVGVGMKRRAARAICSELLDALELTERRHVVAAALPHGEEQKVGVARALASRPRYVLLDEPAAGLSETDIESFCGLVRRVRDDYRVGVLLVDHNMAVIMDVCNRIFVLDQGRSLASGTPAEIRRNIDVTAAYLGSSGVRAAAEADAPSEPADG